MVSGLTWLTIALILTSFVALPAEAEEFPILDGKIDQGEWDKAEVHTFQMKNGVKTIDMTLSIIYSSTTIYFLAIIPHNDPDETINLDPKNKHDYFGIEFDNNGDNAIHGTVASPDDIIMVNYFKKEAEDFYTHSFKVFRDVDNGGSDETVGTVGTMDGTLIFEFSKPLDSEDQKGYDISLKPGQKYQVMLAFWDDQPPHSANVFINNPVGGKIFVDFVVSGTANSDTPLSWGLAVTMIAISGLIGSKGIPEGWKNVLSTKSKKEQ